MTDFFKTWGAAPLKSTVDNVNRAAVEPGSGPLKPANTDMRYFQPVSTERPLTSYEKGAALTSSWAPRPTWTAEQLRQEEDISTPVWGQTAGQSDVRPGVTGASTADNVMQVEVQQQQDIRDQYTDPFLGGAGFRIVKTLTDKEWAALSPEQRQGVIANWTLYQATQADKALEPDQKGDEEYNAAVESMFGAQGGSEHYAPNTVRALQDLGYKNDKGDLDLFLNGSALSSYEDILGTNSRADLMGARNEVTSQLTSGLMSNEGVQEALQSGANLLQALNASTGLSDSTREFSGIPTPVASQIDSAVADELAEVMQYMANRDNYKLLQTSQEANDKMRTNLDSLRMDYGADVVNRFMNENVKDILGPGNDSFMSASEFTQKWLKGKK